MWKIHKINTSTCEVTMEHSGGTMIDLTIPHEHRHPDKANAFLKSACADHEKSPAFIGPAGASPTSPRFQPYIEVVLGLIALAFFIWIAWRCVK